MRTFAFANHATERGKMLVPILITALFVAGLLGVHSLLSIDGIAIFLAVAYLLLRFESR